MPTEADLIAAAIVRRLDGDDLLVDGEEWGVEDPVGDYPAGTLLLEGEPGCDVRIRLTVEIVRGSLS
jgi:hypothetical protein